MQSLIDHVQAGDIPAELCGVISSREGAYALQRAAQHGIAATVISRKAFDSPQAYDAALLGTIEQWGADFLVLAGYLSILGPSVIRRFPNRIINIHPALLPSFGGKGYYGLNVHKKVLEYGVKVTGATVHFVDEGTDTGPIILQDCLQIRPGETPEELQLRVMEIEHRILPEAVALMAQNRLRVSGRIVTIEEEKQQ